MPRSVCLVGMLVLLVYSASIYAATGSSGVVVESDAAGAAELLTGVVGATSDNGSWFLLTAEQLPAETKHTDHLAHFGPMVEGYNRFVLAGIDAAQRTAMDGGGYFTGITAEPAESPIGYPVALLGTTLLDPPRTTSYCSGSSYTAFIEGMNLLLTATGIDGEVPALDAARAEAMRMQEPDGGRREDGIKFWGHWNDNGFGSQFALVQYSGMGVEVLPAQARPGDFMNISWTNGGGHSVVFLGWHEDAEGEKHLLYWSSQSSTGGLSDQLVPLSRIRRVKIVRLTEPGRLFEFDPTTPVNRKVPGDKIEW